LTGTASSGGFESVSDIDEVPEEVESVLEELFEGLQDRVGFKSLVARSLCSHYLFRIPLSGGQLRREPLELRSDCHRILQNKSLTLLRDSSLSILLQPQTCMIYLQSPRVHGMVRVWRQQKWLAEVLSPPVNLQT
jgi:hypothetical protein